MPTRRRPIRSVGEHCCVDSDDDIERIHLVAVANHKRVFAQVIVPPFFQAVVMIVERMEHDVIEYFEVRDQLDAR